MNRNPFRYAVCKTLEQKRVILMKAHLELPALDYDYMPDDLVEKREELEKLMLKYIWAWGNELACSKKGDEE